MNHRGRIVLTRKRGIEHGEAAEYEPDYKKQIQEEEENNPPATEATRKEATRHHANQTRAQGWHRKIGPTRVCVLAAIHPGQAPGKLEALHG